MSPGATNPAAGTPRRLEQVIRLCVTYGRTSIPPDRLAELRAEIPMGRFSAPEEVCPIVGFLASQQAGYITGVVVPVDGGLSI